MVAHRGGQRLSATSPAAWPRVSLSFLKLSMSIRPRLPGRRPRRSMRARAASKAAARPRRFRDPRQRVGGDPSTGGAARLPAHGIAGPSVSAALVVCRQPLLVIGPPPAARRASSSIIAAPRRPGSGSRPVDGAPYGGAIVVTGSARRPPSSPIRSMRGTGSLSASRAAVRSWRTRSWRVRVSASRAPAAARTRTESPRPACASSVLHWPRAQLSSSEPALGGRDPARAPARRARRSGGGAGRSGRARSHRSSISASRTSKRPRRRWRRPAAPGGRRVRWRWRDPAAPARSVLFEGVPDHRPVGPPVQRHRRGPWRCRGSGSRVAFPGLLQRLQPLQQTGGVAAACRPSTRFRLSPGARRSTGGCCVQAARDAFDSAAAQIGPLTFRSCATGGGSDPLPSAKARA